MSDTQYPVYPEHSPAAVSRRRNAARRRQRRAVLLLAGLLAALFFGGGFALGRAIMEESAAEVPTGETPPESASAPEARALPQELFSPKNPGADAEIPEWIEKSYLPVNEFSRPGTELRQVNSIVIHYTGNPGTTAKQNHSYFENLAETGETYASSHFVVGMEGEVVQCVPLGEIAYCTGQRNADTVSIECCHPDDTGEFTAATAESLTELVNWLCRVYELGREDIIRHYDATGKECPRYYVQNPEEWEKLLDTFFPADAGGE